MCGFALTWKKLHVSLGDQIPHSTWSLDDTQDSSGQIRCVPLWSTQLERSTGQMLDRSFSLSLDPVQRSHSKFSSEVKIRWRCCWIVHNTTFHAGFRLRFGNHKRLVATAKFNHAINTTHASGIFRLPILIQSTVCSQGSKPRALDGWQGAKELSPSMQFEPSCKTTHQMKSRNRQANGWQTSRQNSKQGLILLHWVFQRLKVQIGNKCFFFLSFPIFFFIFVLGVAFAPLSCRQG